MNIYSPTFLYSLIKSCYDHSFYERIKNISLARAAGFLFLFSLVLALVSVPFFYSFFSDTEARTEWALEHYDQYAPSFDAVFENGILQTDPAVFGVYLNSDSRGNVFTKNERSESTLFFVEVDSTKSLDGANEDLLGGLSILSDGVYLANDYQSELFVYEDLELSLPVEFSKESLRPLIGAVITTAVQWLEKSSFTILPLVVLLYVFASTWIKAFLFSIMGILFLLLMKKRLNYPFLIKLAIYATVPALLIMFVTNVFSISVSFIPLMVYTAFYFYGLLVHEE